ncbi:MAG: type I DNA topoisomerase [Pirellulaceae bacterium]|nr:type I DNA topoisomerase [Pirellulaceae bacterium]
MAKKAAAGKGNSLVIVESPAKARTISRFLGPGYTVEASIGHVRDLPKGPKELPEQYKAEQWAYLGVDVDHDFLPVYIVPATKKQQVAKLKKALQDADNLYLATDEDREGEAISWHLHEVLKPRVPVHRLVFHEITEEAILDALAHPRQIDDGLVRAQETRRILDRLYGYEVSPLLWRKIGPKLSAGRVQSVAVRLIVERERERRVFVSASYWDLLGTFATEAGEAFQATLVSVDGRRLPSGNDFDRATGRLKDPALLLLDEAAAGELAERLRRAEFRIADIVDEPYSTSPAAPFTTSTLQQEANRKLGFTAKRTMSVAQSLYENGYITYMRTDSTNLAQVAVEAARELVRSEYGSEFLPAQPRTYASKVKNAQEAHEAIRPAGHPFRLPESLRRELDSDQFRLFEMIWKRTIASQMANARGHRITITIEGGGARFQVSGKTIEFAGFLRAYVEGSDDPQAELADKETLLPAVRPGQPVDCRQLDGKIHTTQPPARFSEASLTRELEKMGIGRPSTYAAIIDTILARDYVFKKGRALVPTWVAFSVVRLLEDHLPNLVDYQFTAQMEDFLDAISRNEEQHVAYLRKFFYGNGAPGLKNRVAEKIKEVDARDISRFPLGTPESGSHPEPVFVRVGRYGPFLEQGERRAGIPDGMAPDELTLAKALELLEAGQREEQPLGFCPDTNRPVFLKQGRFGPYVQMGSPDDGERPRNASLLKGMDPSEVDLPTALQLLKLPRIVGQHPDHGQAVEAHNGRFGPYVKCGAETRSLPANLSPLDVSLDEAVELLAQPKTRGRGRAAPKEPLKTFAESPVTGEAVKLLDGRYGPYVTDGQTNASLPKGTAPDGLSFEAALQLLADRAAASPSKRKAAKRKATTKKAGGTGAAKSTVARKKTTKKSAGSSDD